jgi:1-acyl-sn-glycerol-3-phosphate acyltransferase
LAAGATQVSQFRLLIERRFGPFFGVQFLAAFNGHLFRQALFVVLAYQTASFTTMSADTLQNIAQALFVLPFLAFSAAAGQLADRWDKSGLITAAVGVEFGCMALGAGGLLLGSLSLLFAALLLFGVQSALFAAVKYSILPHHLARSELMGGNGLVLTGTAVAIVAGTMIGGLLAAHQEPGGAAVAFFAMAISIAGIALSRAIPSAPAADPGLRINWNPVSETRRNLRFARQDSTVFLSILGMSWFSFYASMFATQLPNLARNVLAGNEHVATLLLVASAAGFAIGSLLCERLSGYKVEIGLVPFGSIGLSLFGVDLWWATASHVALGPVGVDEFVREPGHWRILADLVAIGVFGGLYAAPLCAVIQQRSDPARRARVIAANNILNAAFMIGAAVFAAALLEAGLTIPQLILVTALLNAAVTIYIYRRGPEFLVRFMVWMLIHSVYRLKTSDLERIPEKGPAVIVSNHVSYVDALVISAACRRPIRWVIDQRIFRIPLLSFFFRTVKAIPIAPAKIDPQTLQRAYDAIARELTAGQLVGIFPEGKRTSNGEMNEFKGGVRKILDRTPVPVVPLALRGLWQSIFARNRDKLRHAMKLFPRVGMAVGEPMDPATVTPEGLHRTVCALRGNWK